MTDRPDISVIVPTRNRSSALANLLESLAECAPDGISWEVVVVDNGSTDDTPDVCQRAATVLPSGVMKYVREPAPGLHACRHRGALEASSDVLVFVDDDVRTTSSWLPALHNAFLDPDVELATGPCLPHYEVDPPAWVESTWSHRSGEGKWCGYLSLLDFGDTPREIDPTFVWGLNFAIRREAFQRLRGFHPDALPWELRRYRGDGETGLSLKARAAGAQAWYCPDALVYHCVPASRVTVEYFMRRSYLQGISDSFSDIRAMARQAESDGRSQRHATRWPLRRLLDSGRRVERHSHDARLRAELKIAHDQGYLFHLTAVVADSALLAWVLREDFMDGEWPGLSRPE